MRLGRKLAPRLVHREAVVEAQRLQRLGVERRGPARPGRDRPAVQGLVPVRDHQIGVKGQFDPQTVAHRTGAERIVEREQTRLDLGDGEAGHRTGEPFGKHQGPRRRLTLVGGRPFGVGDAVRQAQRGLQAVGVTAFLIRLGDDPVHHDVDVVFELLVQRGGFVDGIELAVDLQALEALTLPFGDLFLVLALATAHDGGQQQDALSVRQGGQLVDHLADGLTLDGQAGGGRIGDAYARPQQTHIVVDLRHRADGRTRVLGGGLLFDGDGRGQALDQVHVRLAHQLQELPRIGRQALDIAPLALGVDGVERQRGFARAG